MRTEGTGVRGQGPARLAFLAAMMIVVPQTFAQQPPLSPPPQILLIAREFIKPGKRAEVVKIERDSVEEQVRLKSPHSYLTLSSMSGRENLWWLNPADSYGDFEKELAKVAATPGLLEQWTRNPALKADLITDPRQFYARYREDLSFGRGLTGARTRYFLITTVAVRPGHGADFAELRKAIRGAHERARATDIVSVYEVESGLRDGTFLVFAPAANLDEVGAISQFESHGVESALSESARTRFRTLSDSAILESETILFQVNPEISMPAKAWIEGDTEFWSTNPVSNAAGEGTLK